MVVWSGRRISQFVRQPPEIKINPNGVDMKASEVWLIHADAISVLNGKVRETAPEKIRILPDNEGFYNLAQGTYEIRSANQITVPSGAVARFYPRSSFNRLGMISSNTAIGDSGYTGFVTRTVHIPIKLFRIHRDEFFFQMTMEDCEPSDVSYQGHWQGEKPKA
jgi:deoxycytidine triphosphate deaminase